VPHQRRPIQNWPWGLKLPHVQNLGDNFVVFFLGAKIATLEKLGG